MVPALLTNHDPRLVSLFKPRDKVLAALVGGRDVTNLKGCHSLFSFYSELMFPILSKTIFKTKQEE